MRMTLAGLLATAAFLSITPLSVTSAHAQDATVWHGPFCLVAPEGDPRDCSFTSFEQCMQTKWGTSSHCYPNTYYPVWYGRGGPTTEGRSKRHRGH